MSSLNRNIVSLPVRSSNKLIKKSSLIPEYDDVLYKEPISVRQVVGLARWNKILSREQIPKQVWRESEVSSKYMWAISESDTTEDETTGLFGTNSKPLLATDESNKVLKDRKNQNESSTVGTMED